MYRVVNNDSAWLNGHRDLVVHTYPGFSLIECDEDQQPPADESFTLEDRLIAVNGQWVEIPTGRFRYGKAPRQLFRFAGPLALEWLETLENLGIRIHFVCPPFGLCVEIPSTCSRERLVHELPLLQGVSDYQAPQCTRRLVEQRAADRFAGGQPESWLDIVCFDQAQRRDVVRGLHSAGHRILATSKYKIRIPQTERLAEIRKMPGVKLVDSARMAQLAWSPLFGEIGMPSELITTGSLSGQGQVIAVADTGLDRGSDRVGSLHEDFAGRVEAILSWPINPAWDEYTDEPGRDDGAADLDSGHGTHVAGLAVGSGSRSGGKYRGIAPQARLVFQAIEQHTEIKAEHRARIPSGFYLSGRPLDLRALFMQARLQGASIHVNAWGDPAEGQYTDDCYESDLFLWQHADAVVLFAAGNSGADKDGNRLLESGSLYAPASAKNVLAIGATEGPRQGVGFRGGWSGFDPQRRRFSHRVERDDPVSGQPQRIAMISSTGPSRDGRIKPDLCAPGTNLPAPRSQATSARGWGLASPLPHYMYLGGTSMATAVVGGLVALLRQAWLEQAGRRLSGAAVKALLVFGARPVLRRDSEQAESLDVAGFGRVDLSASLPQPTIRLFDDQGRGLNTGEVFQHRFRVERPMPFRAVLSWYDMPGERLVNDLDLCLIRPDDTRVWGNHPPGQRGSADRVNTVERIELRELPVGDYRLQVIAMNITSGSQAYALACSLKPASTFAIQLPVAWLKGVGPAYAARLQQQGIETLGGLLKLDEQTVIQVLRVSARRLAGLLQRLQAIQQQLEHRPPTSILSVSLRRLADTSPPTGMDEQQWTAERCRLMPLIEVFDKKYRSRIRLEDLFNRPLGDN
ncbi:MAG: S8 family serine peptidase [Gammaproteobacteria bacterium]|nr:S8 family serine peptidase [Gammaproteobacteria bacterium]